MKNIFKILGLIVITAFLIAGIAQAQLQQPNQTPDTKVTLAWNAPTTNTDGSPLTDLGGYFVYYGTASRNYTYRVDVGKVLTYTVTNLTTGTWYFSITAYNSVKTESNYSNEVSKPIVSTIPSPPTALSIPGGGNYV